MQLRRRSPGAMPSCSPPVLVLGAAPERRRVCPPSRSAMTRPVSTTAPQDDQEEMIIPGLLGVVHERGSGPIDIYVAKAVPSGGRRGLEQDHRAPAFAVVVTHLRVMGDDLQLGRRGHAATFPQFWPKSNAHSVPPRDGRVLATGFLTLEGVWAIAGSALRP